MALIYRPYYKSVFYSILSKMFSSKYLQVQILMFAYLDQLCIVVTRFLLRRRLRDRSGSSKVSRLLKFDSPTQRSERTKHSSHALSLSLFFFFFGDEPHRPDVAANKKDRKVIEKVEQPRSLAYTCRGACRLYRRARPRDGYEHLDMLSRGYTYTYLDKAISPVLFAFSSIVFQSANL